MVSVRYNNTMLVSISYVSVIAESVVLNDSKIVLVSWMIVL